MASRIIRRADRWEGGWGEIGGEAVEEDGGDSKWEEGAADSGIRGLMSNDGGRGRTGWQRAAGTPHTVSACTRQPWKATETLTAARVRPPGLAAIKAG